MEYRLNIQSDIYCEEDLLGFDKYIETLSKMITNKDFKTPFCIGIFGKWGSGKTSFMHLLEKRLSEDNSKPHPVPVWFNPWRYEKEKHLIIPFLKTIELEIERYSKKHTGRGKILLSKLKNTSTKIGEVAAAFAYGMTVDAKLGGFGITLDTSKAAEREESLAKRRIEAAKTLLEKLSSLYYEIVDELKSTVDEKNFRIVVFIDDLDRCLPDKAVELLEANIIKDKKESDEHKNVLQGNFIPLLYIKWVVIVFRYPKLHNDIKGNKKLLIELQKAACEEETLKKTVGEKTEKKGIQLDERLKNVLKEGKQFPDNDWLIERFIHLTESTVISAKERAETRGFHSSYKPGDMVLIPKGKFLYGDDKVEKIIEYDYEIDVFPLTNKQYKEFIEEIKRDIPYREEAWAKPYNWNKDLRTYPEGLKDHPVVLVSYEDAVAFCEWRSKKERKIFRLPTEEEWEKAARGENGRTYPWGDDFDFKKLNCADYHVMKILKDNDEWTKEFNETFLKKNEGKTLTSEVGRFAEGASPYGCLDMAGNVWELTDSWYNKINSEKVLRGGSWRNVGFHCKCTHRNGLNRFSRPNNVGFRCVRTSRFNPDDMILIPKGKFLYGDNKVEKDIDYDYEIDVFPVINEQYCKFLNDKKPDKNTLNKWISLEGSYLNERCRIIKDGDTYTVEKGYEEHPVIYVSWYGADAYAKWVSKRLPTEQEWEKAARGPDGWIYSWGDKFDASLCNSAESGIGGITEVDRFPKGKSYYGCYDMTGNALEWTDSWDDKEKTLCVVRGGFWNSEGINCRCSYRIRYNPLGGLYNTGFRCARTLVKS